MEFKPLNPYTQVRFTDGDKKLVTFFGWVYAYKTHYALVFDNTKSHTSISGHLFNCSLVNPSTIEEVE